LIRDDKNVIDFKATPQYKLYDINRLIDIYKYRTALWCLFWRAHETIRQTTTKYEAGYCLSLGWV